jgi:hypothetical protein
LARALILCEAREPVPPFGQALQPNPARVPRSAAVAVADTRFTVGDGSAVIFPCRKRDEPDVFLRNG